MKRIVTAPSYLPVTLNEVKRQLAIPTGNTDHDTFLMSKIRIAIDNIEARTGRKLVYQTWKWWLDSWTGPEAEGVFFCDGFYIPFGQLKGIDHVKYTDTDSNVTTWDSGEYDVDTDSDPGRLMLAYSKSWPSASLYPMNPIEIQFSCGWYYGDEWSAGASISSGDIVVPTENNKTGFAYQAGGGGTTGGTEPTWPKTLADTVDDNGITWTCIGETVPDPIRAAIFLMVNDMFQNRGDLSEIELHTLDAVESLISGYILWNFN